MFFWMLQQCNLPIWDQKRSILIKSNKYFAICMFSGNHFPLLRFTAHPALAHNKVLESWITRTCSNIKTCLVHYFLDQNHPTKPDWQLTMTAICCSARSLLLSVSFLLLSFILWRHVTRSPSNPLFLEVFFALGMQTAADTHFFSALVLSVLSALPLPNLTRRPQLTPLL